MSDPATAVIWGLSADQVTALLSGFGGAALGAVVGGAIAWLLSAQAAADSRRRDAEVREAETKGRALRLMVKSSLILTDVAAIMHAIDELLSAANAQGLGIGPFWRRVMPIIGPHRSFEVDADEMAPLIAAKEYKLFQQTIDLILGHQTFVQAVMEYSSKRQAMKDIMPPPVGGREGLLTAEFTSEDLARIQPWALELESIIVTIRARGPELRKLGETVTYAIGPAIRKHLRTEDFPKFVPHEGGQT